MNKILESESPEGLVQGLEALVSVLRNKPFANNVDVELFFKHPEKLISKLRRMEMRDANREVITTKVGELEAARVKLEADDQGGENDNLNLSRFTDLISWGINFCKGAEIETKRKDCEQRVKRAVKASEDAKFALEKTTRLLGDMHKHKFADYFEGDRNGFETEFDNLKRIETTDKDQARKFQLSLHAFDEEFLKDFVEAAHANTTDPGASVSLTAGRFSLFGNQ